MDAREGDPILSADGKRIVAYWACNFDMGGNNAFYFALMTRRMFDRVLVTGDAPDMKADAPRCYVVAHIAAPDRTYWRINAEAPPEWVDVHYFRPSPPEPSPSAAGMVAAFDLVLGSTPSLSGMTAYELRYLRGYWPDRAEYEKRQSA